MNFKGFDKLLSSDIRRLRDEVNSELFNYNLTIRESIDRELLDYFTVVHGIYEFKDIQTFINLSGKDDFILNITEDCRECTRIWNSVETYTYKGELILEAHINAFGCKIYTVWKGV